MKFSHIGIPTTTHFEGGIDLPQLKVRVSDHHSNSFGIQWQRCEAGDQPTAGRPRQTRMDERRSSSVGVQAMANIHAGLCRIHCSW